MDEELQLSVGQKRLQPEGSFRKLEKEKSLRRSESSESSGGGEEDLLSLII